MRKEFHDYIDKKRNALKAHNRRTENFISSIDHFIELIEQHKHYKVINNGVLKKFCFGGWILSFRSEPFGKVNFHRFFEGEYDEQYIVNYSHDHSPLHLIERAKEEKERYIRGVSFNSYNIEEAFLFAIDKLIGDNGDLLCIVRNGLGR